MQWVAVGGAGASAVCGCGACAGAGRVCSEGGSVPAFSQWACAMSMPVFCLLSFSPLATHIIVHALHSKPQSCVHLSVRGFITTTTLWGLTTRRLARDVFPTAHQLHAVRADAAGQNQHDTRQGYPASKLLCWVQPVQQLTSVQLVHGPLSEAQSLS